MSFDAGIFLIQLQQEIQEKTKALITLHHSISDRENEGLTAIERLTNLSQKINSSIGYETTRTDAFETAMEILGLEGLKTKDHETLFQQMINELHVRHLRLFVASKTAELDYLNCKKLCSAINHKAAIEKEFSYKANFEFTEIINELLLETTERLS